MTLFPGCKIVFSSGSPDPSYTCAVDLHLELIEVEPVAGLLWVQVVVEVPGRKPKTVEPQIRSQQQTRWALLIGHPGVAALPAPV